jgi:hypothetical protein
MRSERLRPWIGRHGKRHHCCHTGRHVATFDLQSTPEMAEARDRRVIGVKFTPSSINRSIIYPLDNEARANLTSLYSAIYAGMPSPPDAKAEAAGHRSRTMASSTWRCSPSDEIKQLAFGR